MISTPNTRTFTFHSAIYQSAYVDVTPVETRTNAKVDGAYAPLEPLSSADAALVRTYDAPPYVPIYLAGRIPFIDIANQFVATGGSYNPKILRGKSWGDIASQLSDPTTLITRAILAEADELTAAICSVTGNAPAGVCQAPMVRLLEYRLTLHSP